MPRGNSEQISQYQFDKRYEDWDEPCSAHLQLRMPPSMVAQLKAIPEWQEFARRAIAEAVKAYNGGIVS